MSYFTTSSSSSASSSSSSSSSTSDSSDSFPFHNLFFTNFLEYTEEQRLNLLSVIILSSTPEFISFNFPLSNSDSIENEVSLSETLTSTWLFPLIFYLSLELSLSQEFLESLLPLILKCIRYNDGMSFIKRQSLIEEKLLLLGINTFSFANLEEFSQNNENCGNNHSNSSLNNENSLKNEDMIKIKLISSLIFFFIFHNKYDGRGRSLIRSLNLFLGLSSQRLLYYENNIKNFLLLNTERLNKFLLSSHKKLNKNSNSLLRYAKIGAVSLGAGAVLAVTGGLAAPAIAGALLLMGTSSAAVGVVTLTTMATVFGGAGAGLSGYKMIRRTKGVTEFEFEAVVEYESEKEKNIEKENEILTQGLSCLICISGWEEDPEDYKRSFGHLPSTITDEERLTRFYRKYLPHRLDKVTNELKLFSNNTNDLYVQLKELHGVNPCDDSKLVPNKFSYNLDEQEEVVIGQLLNVIDSILNTSGQSTIKKMTFFGAKNKEVSVKNKVQFQSKTILSNDVSTFIQNADKEMLENYPSTFWHWNELPVSLAYEKYLLRWETDLQVQLGNTIKNMLTQLGTSTVQHILSTTLLTALAAAVALPAIILKLTDIIDSQWSIATERADEAGRELAHALLEKDYGSRPVTLIGYSFGSRVIFSCLRELKKILGQESELEECDDTPEGEIEKSSESNSLSSSNSVPKLSAPPKKSMLSKMNFLSSSNNTSNSNPSANELLEKERKNKLIRSLIQDVILLGTPIKATSKSWASVREVVGGRFINGYSTNDMILGIIYRYKRFQFSVGGTSPVNSPGIENIDLSEIVEKHTDYSTKMKKILEMISLQSASPYQFS